MSTGPETPANKQVSDAGLEASTGGSSQPEPIDRIDLLGNGKVIKEVYVEGTGEYPTLGQQVTVHYTGRLANGTKFDSSRDRDDPFVFTIGVNSVIKGWEVGVSSMKCGERCTLIIDHEFGYGVGGSPPLIPPRSTLHFDIELLKFEDKRKDKQLMSAEERLQSGTDLKEEGNNLIKQGLYEKSLTPYSSGLNYLDNVNEWPEKLVPLGKAVLLGILLNMGLAYLKCNAWVQAFLRCNAALAIDANNVKALYRRGLARIEMGEGLEAKEDLLKALQLEPKNSAVREALDRAKKLCAEQDKARKQTYSKMFA